MRTRWILFILLGIAFPCLASPTTTPVPLSTRIANYHISVVLDAKAKKLEGMETLVWKNTSADLITELQFHLYLNGFRNSRSTFMRESKGVHRGFRQPEDTWGWIDITSLKTSAGDDLTHSIEFIHPDDDNIDDRTVFRIPLPRPVRPGGSITLALRFTAKLPGVAARTGFADDFFMIGQWFPKIGVYEPAGPPESRVAGRRQAGRRSATKGEWNCHQFHLNTEFYADFGVYDVDITVPRNFVVGATGVRHGTERRSDSTVTVFYRAEDVHDFAWTASSRYVDITDQWKHVALHLLIQPEHAQHATRYLSSAKKTLEYFNAHVGPYPYPSMTIVDPPLDALGAGGMEYPMLITGGSVWGIGEQLRLVEQVTVHELGHNYWYGIVANNEFEEAWLDEGVTTYYETRIMDDTYGEKSSVVDVLGLGVGSAEETRFMFLAMRNPHVAPIATKAWEFRYGGYGGITYNKTATYLMTLDRMIGRTTMDSVMRTYFRRWKFRHPSGRDFVAVFNEVVPSLRGNRFGSTLDWFFDQMLYGTGVCDYELGSIQVNRVRKREGVFAESGDSIIEKDSLEESEHVEYTSTVTVKRLGEIQIPVEILVRFSNGDEVREQWGGKERVTSFSYTRPERAVFAQVDPDMLLMIDTNRINNSKMAPAPSPVIWKYTAKVLFWIQNLLQTFAIFG